jgi:hypothetical protein
MSLDESLGVSFICRVIFLSPTTSACENRTLFWLLVLNSDAPDSRRLAWVLAGAADLASFPLEAAGWPGATTATGVLATATGVLATATGALATATGALATATLPTDAGFLPASFALGTGLATGLPLLSSSLSILPLRGSLPSAANVRANSLNLWART